MLLKGKTQIDIDKEAEQIKLSAELEKTQAEVEFELQNILRTIAINKYIENNTGE